MTDNQDSKNIGYAPLNDQRTRKRKNAPKTEKMAKDPTEDRSAVEEKTGSAVWSPDDIYDPAAERLSERLKNLDEIEGEATFDGDIILNRDYELTEELPSINLTEDFRDEESEKIKKVKKPRFKRINDDSDPENEERDAEWATNVAKVTEKGLEREPDAPRTKIGVGGLTIKQERFAQAFVANGGNAGAAYRSAYASKNMSKESIWVEANKLKNNPKVALRIQEIAKDVLASTQVTADKVVAEYAKLAFSNMGDYLRINPDGTATFDLSSLSRDKKAAIQEVKIDRVRTITDDDGEPTGHVERITFKLADKRAALGDLAKYLNMFKEQHEIGVSSDLADLLTALDGSTPRIPTGAPPKAVTAQPGASQDVSTLVEGEDGVWEEEDFDDACNELFGL